MATALINSDPAGSKEDRAFSSTQIICKISNEWSSVAGEFINELGLRRTGSDALSESSQPVLDWIAGEGITHLAVHFDVDVLDPRKFGPIIFNNPDLPSDALAGVPRGRMAPEQAARLLQDVAAACDMVGLAITEYMPWEAIMTRRLLQKLPLLGG